MSRARRHKGPREEDSQLAAVPSHPSIRSSDQDARVQAPGSPDDLGQSILNVLRAAHEEAAQIVSAAEADARAIRESVERETSDLRGRVESEMQESRQQLTVLRDEAEHYANERRLEADLEASRIRAEAEAEVSRRKEELDAATRKLEEQGRRRQELIDASRALEDWLSGTVSTLREVVAKLETVMKPPPAELDQTLLQEVQSAADEVDRSAVDVRGALPTRPDADEWVPLDDE